MDSNKTPTHLVILENNNRMATLDLAALGDIFGISTREVQNFISSNKEALKEALEKSLSVREKDHDASK